MDATARLQRLLSALQDDPELLSALSELIAEERSGRRADERRSRAPRPESGTAATRGDWRRKASSASSEGSTDERGPPSSLRRPLLLAPTNARSTDQPESESSRLADSRTARSNPRAEGRPTLSGSRSSLRSELPPTATSATRQARPSTTNPRTALPQPHLDDSGAYPDIPTKRAKIAVPWHMIDFRFPSMFNRDGLPRYPRNRYLPLRAQDDQQSSDLEAATTRHERVVTAGPSVQSRDSESASPDNLCLPALLSLIIVLSPLVLISLLLTGVTALIDKSAET